VSLSKTYKKSNPAFYPKIDIIRVKRTKTKEGKAQETYKNGWLDDHPYYIVKPGEMLDGRYKLKQSISQGAFGQVFLAENTWTKHEVAIKIIQSKKDSFWQAEREIKLLKHLSKKDPHDEHNIGKF
jgi:serine/threonine protein kinase